MRLQVNSTPAGGVEQEEDVDAAVAAQVLALVTSAVAHGQRRSLGTTTLVVHPGQFPVAQENAEGEGGST